MRLTPKSDLSRGLSESEVLGLIHGQAYVRNCENLREAGIFPVNASLLYYVLARTPGLRQRFSAAKLPPYASGGQRAADRLTAKMLYSITNAFIKAHDRLLRKTPPGVSE